MESPRRSTESHITRHHLLNPATLNTYQPILQAEAESLPVSINSTTSQSKDYNRPWISILLTILAGCLFSTCSLIVKSMVDIDPLELAICRYIGLIIPCLPILIWRKEHMFPKGNRLLLVLRSLAGLIDIIISFYVYRHMPLGEVAAIFYSVPVYVTLFAYIFLKEPCGLVNVVTVTVTLTGVLLVTKPVFLFGEISDPSGSKTFENQTFATVAAFVTTIVAANVYVLLRSMKSVHFSVMLGTYGVFALLPLVAVSWYLDVLRLPKSGLEWLNMIILALLSFMGKCIIQDRNRRLF